MVTGYGEDASQEGTNIRIKTEVNADLTFMREGMATCMVCTRITQRVIINKKHSASSGICLSCAKSVVEAIPKLIMEETKK